MRPLSFLFKGLVSLLLAAPCVLGATRTQVTGGQAPDNAYIPFFTETGRLRDTPASLRDVSAVQSAAALNKLVDIWSVTPTGLRPAYNNLVVKEPSVSEALKGPAAPLVGDPTPHPLVPGGLVQQDRALPTTYQGTGPNWVVFAACMMAVAVCVLILLSNSMGDSPGAKYFFGAIAALCTFTAIQALFGKPQTRTGT